MTKNIDAAQYRKAFWVDQYENARTSIFLARPRSLQWFADDSGRELAHYVHFGELLKILYRSR